eukprot:scaffold8243_cov129-Isochrysis_galbana.AAC.4
MPDCPTRCDHADVGRSVVVGSAAVAGSTSATWVGEGARTGGWQSIARSSSCNSVRTRRMRADIAPTSARHSASSTGSPRMASDAAHLERVRAQQGQGADALRVEPHVLGEGLGDGHFERAARSKMAD